MARIFNFSPQSSLRHIFSAEILTSSLLDVVVAMDNKEVYWPWMLAFCLYAQFLLIFSQEDANIRIISIIEQVEIGANPMPIILAETITGLDNFKEQNHLSGSLLLLQVCN